MSCITGTQAEGAPEDLNYLLEATIIEQTRKVWENFTECCLHLKWLQES